MDDFKREASVTLSALILGVTAAGLLPVALEIHYGAGRGLIAITAVLVGLTWGILVLFLLAVLSGGSANPQKKS